MNSGSWWWTGRPGGLRFMGSQRVGHDWATELNWTVHFPGGARGQQPTCQSRRRERCEFDPWVGIPGGRNGNPLQSTFREHPTDRGACRAADCIGSQRVGRDWRDFAWHGSHLCNWYIDISSCKSFLRDTWDYLSSRGGNGSPLQSSCLGNPMDREAWRVYSPQGHKELDMTEWLTLLEITYVLK